MLAALSILWTRSAVLGPAQTSEALHVSRKYFASSGWTWGAIEQLELETKDCTSVCFQKQSAILNPPLDAD